MREQTGKSIEDLVFEEAAKIIDNSQNEVIRGAFDQGFDLVRGCDTEPVQGVERILQWFSTNRYLQITFETLASKIDGMYEIINTQTGGVMHGFPIHTVPLEVKMLKGHRSEERAVITKGKYIIVHPLGYKWDDNVSKALTAFSKRVPATLGAIQRIGKMTEALRANSSSDPFYGKKPLWHAPVVSFVMESAADETVQVVTFAGITDRKGEFKIKPMNYKGSGMENPIMRLYPQAAQLKVDFKGAVEAYCGHGDDSEEIATELTGVRLFNAIKTQMGIHFLHPFG